MTAYGTMAARHYDRELSFSFAGYSANNARTIPTIRLFRSLLSGALLSSGLNGLTQDDLWQSLFFIQYDDFAHSNVGSVAYGKRRDEDSLIELIPDTYFFESGGYRSTRVLAESRELPSWDTREPKVFWRGSPTTRWRLDDGILIERVGDIPRVKLCETLRNVAGADVGLVGAWGTRFTSEEMLEYLRKERILLEWTPMRKHASYRYQIDIDGVANAWGFFDKLLMGSCILKVGSPFEQWFYGGITPWRHYVPVNADLSDLCEKIDWCFEHPSESRMIALEAQNFALSHTYEVALAATFAAIKRVLMTGV